MKVDLNFLSFRLSICAFFPVLAIFCFWGIPVMPRFWKQHANCEAKRNTRRKDLIRRRWARRHLRDSVVTITRPNTRHEMRLADVWEKASRTYGRTNERTDERTDTLPYRDATAHLKIIFLWFNLDHFPFELVSSSRAEKRNCWADSF